MNVKDLKPNPLNPRGEVVIDDAMRELTESVKSHGLLQPLLVTPDGTVIAGHRRLAACQIAGIEDVPVIVKDIDETAQLEVMLIENMQRQNLNPVQEGLAFKQLMERGLSVNQIAKKIGVSNQTIEWRLHIANLPPETHFAWASGKLSMGCARDLAGLSPKIQIQLVNKAVEHGWTGNLLSSAAHKTGRKLRGESLAATTPAEKKQELITNMVDRLYAISGQLSGYPDLKEIAAEVDNVASKLIDKVMGRSRVRSAA